MRFQTNTLNWQSRIPGNKEATILRETIERTTKMNPIETDNTIKTVTGKGIKATERRKQQEVTARKSVSEWEKP